MCFACFYWSQTLSGFAQRARIGHLYIHLLRLVLKFQLTSEFYRHSSSLDINIGITFFLRMLNTSTSGVLIGICVAYSYPLSCHFRVFRLSHFKVSLLSHLPYLALFSGILTLICHTSHYFNISLFSHLPCLILYNVSLHSNCHTSHYLTYLSSPICHTSYYSNIFCSSI